MLRTKGAGDRRKVRVGMGIRVRVSDYRLSFNLGLKDAVRCKENALAKTENRLKNAFGSSTAYDVAGHFSDSRRASQSRFSSRSRFLQYRPTLTSFLGVKEWK